MHELAGKSVLVVGLGKSGMAAARFLHSRGARVAVVDSSATPDLEAQAKTLRALGIPVALGQRQAASKDFDLAVISPGVSLRLPLLQPLRARGTPIIGELELAAQHVRCPNVSITGTNGKTTTTELVERMLTACQRKTIAAGNIGLPLCDLVDQANHLHLFTLEVSSFQLETIQLFRPAIAVLLNLAPDHMDRYSSANDYLLAKARLFENQQSSDWAIIQSEALAQLRAAGVALKAQLVTFSASGAKADIRLEGSRIVGCFPDGDVTFLDLKDCRLRGAHNAENLMATLAVGRALKLPLRDMQKALQSYAPAPHRCERLGEINGVLFVNDSKATNPHAVAHAIAAMPASEGGEPNILLIAGGKEKSLPYGDLAPMLAKRVKRAYLLGETRLTLLQAWSRFTPCVLVGSLLEAVTKAAEVARAGDIVLLSPACSSFDMFRDYQQRGDEFRTAVRRLQETGLREFALGSAPASAEPVALNRA